MTNRLRWTRTALAALLTVSLLGLPQIAAARDRYARRSYNNVYYDGQDYNYGYRDYNGAYGGYYPDTGYRYDRYYGDGYGYGYRSREKSAAIIGGSAATGAIIGAIAGGGKGAAIGAAVGGLGGLIFDRSTRHDRDRDRW